MLPSLSLQRHHYRRIAFFAVPIIIFHHRLSVLLTLLYTFVAFTFLPHAILGDGDGWDLENLIPPMDAPEVVPRIIHQARLGNLSMKEEWTVANATCAELHPGPQWQFELWDTERANAFVAENYPDLLDTYLGYEQEIQRSDIIRYLILYKMGGIYLDLDIKCLKPLDFFLTVDWISPPGLPVGLNNAFMAVAPGHPFLKHTVDNIKRFDLNWYSLYITDMFSAGCHYISTMHATYSHRSNLRVLPREYKLGGPSITPIFQHLGAASWHRGDASAIKLIGNFFEWFLDPWKIFFFAGICISFCVWISGRRARMAAQLRVEDTELLGLPDSRMSLDGCNEELMTHEQLDAEISALDVRSRRD